MRLVIVGLAAALLVAPIASVQADAGQAGTPFAQSHKERKAEKQERKERRLERRVERLQNRG